MIRTPRLTPWLLSVALACTSLWAQSPPPEETAPAGQVEEVIVVTASRTEQHLHDVPMTMSVISATELETAPVENAGEVLRSVPGLNVAQMGARDISISARESTNSLATGQLVLLDNRTLYLDFFGFVAWDFVPLDFSEIKQIEIVRGPGSAVWGANALSGVINLITKSPREMQGTSLLLGAGELDTRYAHASHAGATERFGYKVSAAYFEQSAYERPTGPVPGTNPPRTYPSFVNEGTKQPKLDVRFDWDRNESSTFSFAAGYAGTDGIVHSGLGPFNLDSGSSLSFAKVDWRRQSLHLTGFINRLDGDATNELTIGVDGRPLAFHFGTDTYNLDLGDTKVIGEKYILTYGANARHNAFDITLAPEGTDRNEYGIYGQAEVLLSERFRVVGGARFDHLDPIGEVVSPRAAALFAFTPDHTLRASWGRAFRAPSVINAYIEAAFISTVVPPLAPGAPAYPVFTRAIGNRDIQEERADTLDVGYVGSFGDTTLTFSLYETKQKDLTDFYVARYYSPANPPAGWPYPVIFLAAPPLNGLPAVFSFRNIGEITNRGAELSLAWRPEGPISTSFSYSYQAEAKVEGVNPDEIGKAPRHRANFGLGYDGQRFFANGSVSHQSKAYWADVLDMRGYTPSATIVNLTLGYRLFGEKVKLSLIAHNVLDERVQQHLFGDIISRKVTAQIGLRF